MDKAEDEGQIAFQRQIYTFTAAAVCQGSINYPNSSFREQITLTFVLCKKSGS